MTNELTTRPAEASLIEIRQDPHRFPRLKTFYPGDVAAAILPIVSMAYNYRGQHAAEGILQVTAESLATELLRNDAGSADLSVEEIRYAIRKEVLTAENFYPCVASLYRCVMNYVKGEGHQLQAQIKARRIDEDRKALRDSAVGTMLAAYSIEMINNNKPSTK